jgi:hypothetical protein
MNLRHLLLAAAGVCTIALAGCGGTTLQVEPAAATFAVASPSPAGEPPDAAVQAPAGTACDATPWRGAIDPEGRPDSLDAGDAGAVYVWHDGSGWHIRTTDRRPTDHHYTGTIRLEPLAASFVAIRTVRDERDDRVFVDGTNVLHYDFHTHASVDGADFLVTCPPQRRTDRERLDFHTDFDGHPVADRVRIGAGRQSPRTADFSFVRSA